MYSLLYSITLLLTKLSIIITIQKMTSTLQTLIQSKNFHYLYPELLKLRFEDPELVTILQQELIMNSKRTEKFKQILLPTWIRVKTLLSNGRNEELFAFQNIENALSCVMAIATFPRQNSMYIDSFIELGDEKEITEETLLFILKGLSFVS